MTVFQDTERWMCCLVIWREARGSSRAAKAAILAVIRNRAEDKAARCWPRTMLEVILQPKQFSSFNANDPNAVKLPNPRDKADWAAWQECVAVVDSGLEADPTGGATNYLSGDTERDWAKPEAMTLVLGPFRFFKL